MLRLSDGWMVPADERKIEQINGKRTTRRLGRVSSACRKHADEDVRRTARQAPARPTGLLGRLTGDHAYAESEGSSGVSALINRTAIAGVHLERTGATVLLSECSFNNHGDANTDPLSLKFISFAKVEWHPRQQQTVKNGLKQVGKIIKELSQRIESIGVSSYGPFESLTPPQDDGRSQTEYTYGKIRSDNAHPPLRGFNVDEFVRSSLGKSWSKDHRRKIVIQTDANACAVGEAYLRQIPLTSTLAFLYVGEGVGLGLARGREVVQSALHPEVGLLPAYPEKSDPLVSGAATDFPIRSLGSVSFASTKTIAQLASNSALSLRLQRTQKLDHPPTMKEILAVSDRHFWDSRAAYLAQGCIACTTILPPDHIVVGAQIDPLNNIDKRTWFFFREFLGLWKTQGQPVFDYIGIGKLRNERFISKESGLMHLGIPPGLPSIGAIGMCYLAASAISKEL